MGRNALDTYVRGEEHPNSKLLENEVRNIRESTASVKDLAGFYGVTQQQIRNIKKGIAWKHVK